MEGKAIHRGGRGGRREKKEERRMIRKKHWTQMQRGGWVAQGLTYRPATLSDSFIFEGEDIDEKRYQKFLRELRRLANE